jgi:hypothetical protein
MKNVLATLVILGAEQLLVASVGNGSSAGAIQTLNLLSDSGDGKNRELEVIQENHNCGFSPT